MLSTIGRALRAVNAKMFAIERSRLVASIEHPIATSWRRFAGLEELGSESDLYQFHPLPNGYLSLFAVLRRMREDTFPEDVPSNNKQIPTFPTRFLELRWSSTPW